MALLVKRGCDEGFQPLGEVIKMWGRVPFAPGPSPPPLLVSTSTWRGAGRGSGSRTDGGGWCGARPGQRHRSALAPTQGNMDQERLKKQQELAAAALYQQLQHQQFLQLVGRYGGLEGLVGQAGRRLCGLSPLDTGLRVCSRQLPQCALREKAALGDLTPPQQQLTAFLQQLQALKPPRSGASLCRGGGGQSREGLRS